MKKKKLLKKLNKISHRIETHIALNSHMRNENLEEASGLISDIIIDTVNSAPKRPVDTTYQAHLANHLAIENNTSVVPLIQREPSYTDVTEAVWYLRGIEENDDRLGKGGNLPFLKDIEFYIEVDRAVINEIDTGIANNKGDPTFPLRPLLRPAAIRLSQSDVILHVTSVDLIDSYTPQPTPIA